jgi:integron integrase
MSFEQSHLLERAHQAVKERYLSTKTESAYLNHIRRFLEFNKNKDLSVKRADRINVFLTHLREGKLGASGLNQARCALLFFYRDVLGHKLPAHFDRIKRATQPDKKHVVFTPGEVEKVLANLRDAPYLIAALIYGSGLRLPEAVGLRVRDIDFEHGEVIVRDPRSARRERGTVLPQTLFENLRRHMIVVKFTHEDDTLSGFGRVFLPEKIYHATPKAAYDWGWQYLFPAGKLSTGKNGGITWRHHLAESTVQKAVAEATVKANISKQGCCQALRYSFAVSLFEGNHDPHTIQNLLGHKTLKTTMIYLQKHDNEKNIVQSPLDRLAALK